MKALKPRTLAIGAVALWGLYSLLGAAFERGGGPRSSERTAAANQELGRKATFGQANVVPEPGAALPQAGSGSRVRMPTTPAQEDVLSEEEDLNAYDRTPHQREWRATYIGERHDEQWTRQMSDDIERRARAMLSGDVTIDNLSCRETVCRMYLDFESKPDAEAFIAKAFVSDRSILGHEFQPLDPFDGKGKEPAGHTYELLVRRARPAGSEPRGPVEGPRTVELPASTREQLR